jgi:hypothetical protein
MITEMNVPGKEFPIVLDPSDEHAGRVVKSVTI